MTARQNPRPTETPIGRIGFLLFFLMIVAGTAAAQFPAADPRLRPAIPENGSLKTVVGLSFSMPPREIVGEMVSTVPMAELEVTYALPEGFSLHAAAASVYLINEVSVGGGYTAGGENLTVTVGGTMTWWYGIARMEGFNASARGSLIRPSVDLAYRHKECVAHLKADATMDAAQESSIGSASLNEKTNRIVGASLAASLEHTFSRNVTILLGAKLNYARPGHETWMAFPATGKWMTYPTFSLGYVL